jgi:hypothetical protein
MVKKKCALVFILLFSIIFFSCHLKRKPELALSIVNYNFGNICKDSVYKGSSIITNIGNAPLIIDKIDSSCGCTSVSISKDTILPQDTCLLTFNFSTYNKRGTQENFICIISNTDSLAHLLEINAYVE